MGLRIKLIALVMGLVFFLFVFGFVKRKSIKPSYASLWLVVGMFLISIPLLEGIYTWFTYSVIGLVDARSTIYIGLIGFLLIYVFYVTTKVSKMEDRIQELISFSAILGRELEELRDGRKALPPAEGTGEDGRQG